MPKKQPFQKITNRELEILQLLWHTDHPLIASEIATLKPDLTINTVQAVLRNLLKYKYIEVADIVYSVTSFAKPAAATERTAVEATSDITARKAITRWYYKTINGKLYKRLYDCTHEKWLTDWLPC